MTRQLRQRKSSGVESDGLVLANGGVLTYQHVVILSSLPRKDNNPYPSANPLSASQAVHSAPPIAEHANGAAIIEVCSLHSGKPRSRDVRTRNSSTRLTEKDLYRRIRARRRSQSRTCRWPSDLQRSPLACKPCRRSYFAFAEQFDRRTDRQTRDGMDLGRWSKCVLAWGGAKVMMKQ